MYYHKSSHHGCQALEAITAELKQHFQGVAGELSSRYEPWPAGYAAMVTASDPSVIYEFYKWVI